MTYEALLYQTFLRRKYLWQRHISDIIQERLYTRKAKLIINWYINDYLPLKKAGKVHKDFSFDTVKQVYQRVVEDEFMELGIRILLVG